MNRKKSKIALRFLLSKRATALPVSFLMLFVSLTIIVSATYYVSVAKIQARGQLLNIAVAKQNMLYFEDSVGFTKWSPGTSTVYNFEDSGATFKTYPTAKSLLVNVTDNNTFHAIAFNSSIGKAVYELPPAETAVYTFYMKGDRRAIINQSAFTMAQLCLSPGTTSPELTLTYRPLATISETGFSQGKPVNTLRLYIINLNTSTTLTAQGEFNIKSTCTNVTSNLQTYNFSYRITTIFVKATFDERTDIVALPVSSNAGGAFVKVETLVCNIKLERIQGGG
ncbi:MAG: hypothetical protein OEX01_08650 [Candidatus Bathyarchaeota archaeon]|nr:hypothetical protein [Candidatus Bathyarchaeota archaeon]